MNSLRNSGKNILRVLAVALTVILCFDSIPALADNYRTMPDVMTFDGGKYIIQQSSCGDIVYDADGNVVISPGRYCRAEYLGNDRFAVYKVQDGNNISWMTSKEMGHPYLLDLKTGKETKLQLKFQTDNPNIDVTVHPYSNGYARVENGAFYAWTSMVYYQFIDKNGKSIMSEMPYSYCSDMLKAGKEYFFFTKGDELSFSSGADRDSLRRVVKRDINGKALKNIVLPEKFAYELDVVKYSKKFYLRIKAVASEETKYLLYNTDLKKVTKFSQNKIKNMKTYDTVDTWKGMNDFVRTDEHPHRDAVVDGRRILERDWVMITPFTTAKTSWDVTSASKDEGAWVMLYDTKATGDTYSGETVYEVDGPGVNQLFMFEKVGTDDDGNGRFRIWAAHSGRQLRSYYDSNYKITVLSQGSYEDKNSKGKELKEQIFTVIENSDGSFSVKDYKGKYLTMSYGSTDSGTVLVFADYAGGDSKQKFKAEGLYPSFGGVRNGEKRFGDFYW